MKGTLLVAGIVLVLLLVTLTGLLAWSASGQLSKEDYESGILRQSNHPARPSDGRYTIVTYNIGYASGMTNNTGHNASREEYDANLRTIIAALEKVNPDIVAFQEIDYGSERSYHQEQLTSIADALALRYRAQGFNWDKNYLPWPYWPPSEHFGRMLSGQAIASAFPIVEHGKLTLPKPTENSTLYNWYYIDRIAQIAELDIDGTPLVVINVHLEAFVRAARERQSKLLAQAVRPHLDKPLILLGDFNALPPWCEGGPGEETLDNILSLEGIRSAIPEETYTAGPPRTHFTAPADDPVKAIDHIFYNDRIRCLRARVMQDAGTGADHLPVLMEFSFRGSSSKPTTRPAPR